MDRRILKPQTQQESEDIKREMRELYDYPRMSLAHTLGAEPILVTEVCAEFVTPSGIILLAPEAADKGSFAGASVKPTQDAALEVAFAFGVIELDGVSVKPVEEKP